MAALIAGAWVLIVVAAFVAGHEMHKLEQPEGTAADIATGLQLLVEEGVISPEQRETFWAVYVTKVRTT